MVFRKHGGGNRYGNFLRRTFDKVREVTRRVRIVRLLLPRCYRCCCRCCSCSETLACGTSLPRRYEEKIACEISFPRWDARTVERDQNRTARDRWTKRDIYFSVTTRGRYPPWETFYIMLTCARNGPPGLSSTRGRVTRKFENALRVPAIVRQSSEIPLPRSALLSPYSLSPRS